MKDYSAAQIKRGAKVPLQQIPRKGTKVRELFDLFHTYKGQIIDFGKQPNKQAEVRLSNLIKYLYTFYGFDIAHIGRGKWRFCGEYIGPKYLSYVNDKPLNVKVKQKEILDE